MNEFAEWSMQRFDQGAKQGAKEERSKCVDSLADYLVYQSKQEGKVLSQKDALKQAETMLSYKC